MILPLAVVTTLALTCAPQVAPATLVAIAQTESGLDPLAVGDNTAHRSYHPAAKSEAVALAVAARRRGSRSRPRPDADQSAEFSGGSASPSATPLSRAESLAAGAAVLTALSRYNTGKSSSPAGMAYARRVISQGKEEEIQQKRPAEPMVEANWRMFDDDRSDDGFLIRRRSK